MGQDVDGPDAGGCCVVGRAAHDGGRQLSPGSGAGKCFRTAQMGALMV